jgi:hypothetical protein
MDNKKYIVKLLREGPINEVDWEGDFSDTQAKCVTPQSLADDMNKELGRLNLASKDRDKRGTKDVIYTRNQMEKNLTADGELDVAKFKKLITTPPKTIFDQNPKMEKSDDGGEQMTVNTGLPAINGIIYDNDNGKFYHINTCPGAGSCQLICYARKGFYGMNDGKVLKLIRRLNLLMNDPTEYYNMIMDELEPLAFKLKRQGRRSGSVPKLVMRWNDAGDFFSQKYFDIAVKVTKDLFDAGFDVKSYAYTKQAKFVNLASDDFIMNFSKGSAPKELRQVDLETTKYSDVIPKKLFKGLFYPKANSYKKDEDGLPIFVDGGKEELRRRVAKEYDIDINRLKYHKELPSTEGEKFQYDVIVLPTGDTDISAQRQDVHKTFLAIH